MHITNRDDLRVGDIATFAFDGHEFTGRVWAGGGGALYVGASLVRDSGGPYEFVSGTREAPPLPTEPGSVILVSECRGERVDVPVLAVCDGDGKWRTFGHMFDGCMWHRPEHIGAWTPARVVAA